MIRVIFTDNLRTDHRSSVSVSFVNSKCLSLVPFVKMWTDIPSDAHTELLVVQRIISVFHLL